MEHYRSTLATTALAVFGLIAAARIMHPDNFAEQPRGVRVAAGSVEAASGATTWADPPLRLRDAEPALLTVDSDRVLSPRLTVALPRGALTVPRLPSALVAPVVEKAKADPLGDLIRTLDHEEG